MTAHARQAAEPSSTALPGRRDRTRRRRKIALAAAAVVIGGGGSAAGVTKPWQRAAPPLSGTGQTTLEPVTRQSLSEQATVDGTLGYAGSYSVSVSASAGGPSGQAGGPSGQVTGTFTAVPEAGQVVRRGQRLYSVDASPTVLLYGAVPAYRSLSEGMTGTDVRQLNANLVALGDATRSELDPGSDFFSAATAAALKKFQDGLGLQQTGSLTLGQAVFLPTAVRVSSGSAELGAPAQPGAPVLRATSTTRQAVAQVSPSQLPDVMPGAQVTVTLPDDKTTSGVVTSVGNVASPQPGTGSGTTDGSGGTTSQGSTGDSASTVEVDITLTHSSAAGAVDQAPVQVTITTATVHGVLAVPVAALLAEPGGYAVEVAGPHRTRHIVPVSLGLFDDAAGLVQVAGKGLAARQQVVVPKI